MRIQAQRAIFTVCKTPRSTYQRLNIQHQCRTFSSTPNLHNESESNTPRSAGPQRHSPRGFRRTQEEDEEMLWDLDEVEDEDERHMSNFGWEIHRQQKEFFDFMRILQRDVPILERKLPNSSAMTSVQMTETRSSTYL